MLITGQPLELPINYHNLKMSIKKYTQMKIFRHFIELILYCLILDNKWTLM